MDLNDTPDQAEYRATVRAWIEANKSKAPTHLGDDDESVAAHRAWQRELAGGKLVGITWPQEFGGGLFRRLPKRVKNGVRDCCLCHYLAVFKQKDGSLVQVRPAYYRMWLPHGAGTCAVV